MILQDSWAITHDNLENEIMKMKQIETIIHEKQLKSIDFDDFEYFSVSFAIFF